MKNWLLSGLVATAAMLCVGVFILDMEAKAQEEANAPAESVNVDRWRVIGSRPLDDVRLRVVVFDTSTGDVGTIDINVAEPKAPPALAVDPEADQGA